ncbi:MULTISPECIES: hypothetical protein [unclassified Streptomyces]|uniref:hypothetical protein n=1 Tax=unclassified Streptomyces TaxID=2593676 RepID=UPI0022581074|nr:MULTISPECIES: hypothetical protein [unclassified Streptomyces]MCX4527601.1 hypothetical protein [Streptomyces sp. NBC_01551]MCX4541801.1 hypothetical protein [Streptomyces sp. NBC_01565]
MSQQSVQPPAPDSYTPAPAPAPARSGNVALAVGAAALTALASGCAYGGIMGAIEYQIGYLAAGVGLLVGLVASRLGGRNPILPAVSALLTLVGVYAGYVLCEAVLIHKGFPPISVTEGLTSRIAETHQSYLDNFDPISVVFFLIGAYVAFQTTRKASA